MVTVTVATAIWWLLWFLLLLASAALFVYVVVRVVQWWLMRSQEVRSAIQKFLSRAWERYRAALIVCAIAIPYLSAFFACVDYLAPLQVPASIVERMPSNSFLAGTLVALIAWLALPLVVFTNFSSGSEVSPDGYAELQARSNDLKVQLEALTRDASNPSKAVAHDLAAARLESLKQALAARGTQWLWGYGYTSAWGTLHAAEAALIAILPQELVCQGALVDHLRLHDSTIENREELNRNLAFAAVRLDGSMAPIFDMLGAPATPASSPSHPQLRSILVTVRQSINTFRDSQWVSMVNTRNLLYKIMGLLGVGALLLLGLCISKGASPQAITAAVAYFVVGIILGRLFSQFSTTLQSNDTVGEDYGLSTARMLATPLFTGLAAVGGVFLAITIPSILDFTPALATSAATPSTSPLVTVTVQPTTVSVTPTAQPTAVPSMTNRQPAVIPLALREAATPAATATATAMAACTPTAGATTARRAVPTLDEIFDYNPIKFIIAAFFGLTPAYFFDRLGQANRQIMNIISTEPTGRGRI